MRARQLRVELCALTLDNSFVLEYLPPLEIQLLHHIDVILKGLPSKFAPLVSVISKFGLMDLDEVEIVPDLVSLDLTHVALAKFSWW